MLPQNFPAQSKCIEYFENSIKNKETMLNYFRIQLQRKKEKRTMVFEIE